MRFNYKFQGQRKTRDWVVYPDNGNGTVKIQADDCIAVFDPKTRKGRLCLKGAYGPDLMLKGVDHEFTEELVNLALDTQARQEARQGLGGGVLRLI